MSDVDPREELERIFSALGDEPFAKTATNLGQNILKVLDLRREKSRTLRDQSIDDIQRQVEADEIERIIASRIASIRREMEQFARFPYWHARHRTTLRTFAEAGEFGKSVFIMTKFPDDKGSIVVDRQLKKVINTVAAAIRANGFVPRIASDRDYYPQLWDNVELHMLGCNCGIAIVQDKVKDEFNPNVAIEWGWMMGLDRRVLYLVERDFKNVRADWKGMISYEFEWAAPEDGIRKAVKKFLESSIAVKGSPKGARRT